VTAPTVKQVRRQVVFGDGSVKFEITTSVLDKGDLPYQQLFVVTIVDPLNEKEDVLARLAAPTDLRAVGAAIYVKVDSADLITISGDIFARVANSSDLTSLPRDRATALIRGSSTYLTSTVTLLYDTQITAEAAVKTILDRLSQLVVDWRAYNTTFLTSPFQIYALPLVSSSVEAEYTATYRTKKTATSVARAARDAAQLASDTCAAQDTLQESIIGILLGDVAFLELAKSRVTAMVETGSVLLARTFVLNAADAASYETLLTQKRTQLNQQQTAARTHRTSCATLARAVQTAETVLQTAQTAEQAALTALLRVCPTFDPNSVQV
jgi:hypothetical protein